MRQTRKADGLFSATSLHSPELHLSFERSPLWPLIRAAQGHLLPGTLTADGGIPTDDGGGPRPDKTLGQIPELPAGGPSENLRKSQLASSLYAARLQLISDCKLRTLLSSVVANESQLMN